MSTESKRSEVDERVAAVQMLSNLCNVRLKVQGLTDKVVGCLGVTVDGGNLKI